LNTGRFLALYFFAAIFSIKYIRDQSIEIIGFLKKHFSRKNLKNLKTFFKTLYVHNYHVIFSTIVAIIILIFQIYHIILYPHYGWVRRWKINYPLTLINAIIDIISAAVFWFVISNLFFFLCGNIYLYKWICGKLTNIEVMHPDKMGGLSFLSTYARSIMMAWLLSTLPFMHTYIFALVTWWTIFVLSTYIIVTIGIICLLSLFIHKVLNNAKNKALETITQIYSHLYENILEHLDGKESSPREILSEVLFCITARDFREVVNSMKTFPIRIEISLSTIFTSALPLIIHIIKNFLFI